MILDIEFVCLCFISVFPLSSFSNMPSVPDITLFPRLLTSAILIAFVSYVVTYSLGKMYAKKHGNYEVSENQELIALGACNVFSSFFLCFPCSGSLARSAVQERVGGKTQLTSLVSVAFIVIFITNFSSYLTALPQVGFEFLMLFRLWNTESLLPTSAFSPAS